MGLRSLLILTFGFLLGAPGLASVATPASGNVWERVRAQLTLHRLENNRIARRWCSHRCQARRAQQKTEGQDK